MRSATGPHRRVLAAIGLLTLAACASPVPEPADEPDPTLPPAPWSADPLTPEEVPHVFVSEWSDAENRETCALLAPESIPGPAEAAPRAANFAGGWAVAFDLPQLRSAFGVAGTGVSAASDHIYEEWPFERRWADGSAAGYGPEGGTGPNTLAYLEVRGQDCLYNVWSRLGKAHLEDLLERLRFVRPA